MTKGQIHFSNDLRKLFSKLKENLFFQGSHPFEERLCVVPHLGLKEWIMNHLAKDPQLKVAAGVEIVNLSQGMSRLFGTTFPKTLELSLAIEYELLEMIKRYPELKDYFGKWGKIHRIGPFSDTIASYFLRYLVYGKPEKMPLWQEELWKLVIKDKELKLLKGAGQVHLFGFSFLPQKYLTLFDQETVSLYLFSPCGTFWGDYYSDKELAWMGSKLKEEQLDLFSTSFSSEHPLLSNWGKVGRLLHNMVEDQGHQTEELYTEPPTNSALEQLQNSFLNGESTEIEGDDSLFLCTGATVLRELEHVRDYLYRLFTEHSITPKDVQVIAPDISLYYPYIKMVFDQVHCSISDVSLLQIDPVAKAFSLLLNWPKERFDTKTFLQLLDYSVFSPSKELPKDQVETWLEKSQIRWGLSEKQRGLLFAKEGIDLNEDHIGPLGTWEQGLGRLILGLGDLNEKEGALPLINVTQIESLNSLYTLIGDLEEDLSPLIDGTEFTIPLWLRYFCSLLENYFLIDSSNDLYTQLRQYAFATSHLDEREVPFEGVERVVHEILTQKTKRDLSSHLQSIQFCSANAGAIVPTKVICFIGMDEEAFPKTEEVSSLYLGTIDPYPKKSDMDRYHWLVGILSAKERFYASWVRDPLGKKGPSPLIEELKGHITGLHEVDYPASPLDPAFFNGTYLSYDKEHFALANEPISSSPPLATGLYLSTTFEKTPCEETLSTKQLFMFARHPLRFFLREVHGIFPGRGFETKPEYLLSPMQRAKWVSDALHRPLDDVIDEAKIKGEFPLQLLEPLAKEQIVKECELWKETLESYGLHASDLYTLEVDQTIGPFEIKGELEMVSDEGMLVYGKDCLADRIRFWPQALILKKHNLPILFVKDQKRWDCSGDELAYLEYFQRAKTYGSLLLPSLASAFLEKGVEELKKQIKLLSDETISFLELRDGPIPLETAFSNWAPYLQEVFGGVHANV